ncbi:Metal transporter Nramp6 [Zea mays]|uniref:Metal transporter Nramp3 n=2 Tax=Zea mays TaxID=4577 RepID=A0A1D6KY99_MAIZE|nr:metal transporter Nramp6 [Zea mays]ONM07417.1 Metal transporter Nramp3 [Zea mays]PWZ54817.1 Metal transporter Nramp6 [Zea mays]|eukprot:XP_008665146.1 metal transporter Nramp6 [Zea mays]
MAANHNADDAAREPVASASPPASEAEHRALLRPSSFISAISDDNEGCKERAFEPSEKVIVSVSGDPEGDASEERAFYASGGCMPPFSWRKLWAFSGPGFLMSIAFVDPGNIEGDLQAGATAGGTLLWVLVWATAMGLLVQLHAARLGVATGRHLAELCRDEYPDWARRALWLMAEVALVSADIQEVIGSAIAIKILSHGLLPLWGGVVITALDCFMILSLENYGVRKLEALFAVLITTMACSFAWMFVETEPSGKDLFIGILVPKLSSRSIKQAVGLVGCVITPHNVFLHSALVQSRKIDPDKEYEVREALRYYSIESTLALVVPLMINLFVTTVFAKGFYGTKEADSIGLENAGKYLQEKFGGDFFPILYIWGVGLLAAGTSSTITGTYAGQFIMGGFLNWRLKKWIRALITRSFAIVPTIIVALYFNNSGYELDVLNEWLNVLQSVQIPFSLIPLITLVSKEEVMGVYKIGPRMKILTWIVASLPILINSYMLLDFFSLEMGGMLYNTTLCVAVVAYSMFILYLIFRGMKFPSYLTTT